jgi:hypothetical protein
MFRNRLIFLFALVCLAAALAPLSDFDFDGHLDSLVTEGLILLPLVGAIAGLFSLWVRFPAACFTVSQQFSSLLVPPPINN